METILMLLFMLALIWVVYTSTRAQLKVTKNLGYDYIIVFRGLDHLPDLSSNPHLKDKLKIYSQTDGHFAVQSHFNDTKLKEIIMQDYGLDTTQVQVQSTQLSGALGAL